MTGCRVTMEALGRTLAEWLFAVGSRQVSGCGASEINVPTSCPQTRLCRLWRLPIRTFEREIYVPLRAAGDKSSVNVHLQAEQGDRRWVKRLKVHKNGAVAFGGDEEKKWAKEKLRWGRGDYYLKNKQTKKNSATDSLPMTAGYFQMEVIVYPLSRHEMRCWQWLRLNDWGHREEALNERH